MTTVLFGTPIDDVTLDEAVERIAEMVQLGRQTGRTHQVTTVNVDFLVNATSDPDLLRVMQRADLSIPDGMGVVWGAALTGVPLRARTSGVDLVPALVARAAMDGWRVCLFGGSPGTAEEAAAVLAAEHPGATVVGVEGPMIAADGTMDESVLDVLRAVDADVIGVALGNPKQERWINRYGAPVGAPVLIGIGGTLDFLTGRTNRAPDWMQRSGLEWIHRAASEPRRLVRRYAKDLAVFGPGLLRQAWRGRRRGEAVLPLVSDVDGTRLVRLLGRTDERRLLTSVGEADGAHLDLTGLSTIDNATLAAMAGLDRARRRTGASIDVTGVSPTLEAAARRLNGDAWLDSGTTG